MAQVEIVSFAHFYNEGVRGSRGGAASNDKVWGVAIIDNKLVNFWGRRNGKLKFKTHFKTPDNVVELEAKFEEKTTRRTGDRYTPIRAQSMIDTLCPNLVKDVTSHFYSDMSLGKLNTRH